ncbi:MAG TPA: prolyl oligopeptidase family serine peptidase [Vicinamibacteria bacterium]|nr:prolyl oligopeptidase family serine peptidase [Vicinamibacteria bacterium]
MKTAATLGALLLAAPGLAPAGEEDPFQWLEEIQGDKALAWARERSAAAVKELEAVPEFQPTYARALAILDSKEKIPAPELLGTTVYNFWKDEGHERGLWRRTGLDSYAQPQPDWETVLDVDALAKAEGEAWVFKGAACFPPAYRRCLVALSRGGADATVQREFDTGAKRFVEDGFSLPEAKSSVAWRDADTLWVGTDFGPGTLTDSGYPRIVKLWKRGTPLTEARTVFEADPRDVAATGFSIHTPEARYDLVVRTPAFFRQEAFLVLGERLVKLSIPDDAELHRIFKDQVLLSLRSDWSVGAATYKAGSLLAVPLDELLRGPHRLAALFEPTERTALASVANTRDRILAVTLDNVKSRIQSFRYADGEWRREDVPLPGLGTAGVVAASDEADVCFFSYEDFLTPPSLHLVTTGGPPSKAKSMPAFFDSRGLQVAQHEATSRDGTRIPYFVVAPAGFVADGSAPTLLYGYGGFEVAEVPAYSPIAGSAWLERGGVYVLANIRGGGEFGPRWHEAALKERRIKSFEDFIAVAEDLGARRITSRSHLGIMGGSQGGLLVGGAFAMRPELFGAVVAQIPLADMRRYSKLLAGASWMAEYGDPDVPEQWDYIRTWSPYHLLRRDARYPPPFYWTNTRDDRVHPAHARKMVARLEALGHAVYYFENTEGGHGAGAVNKQTAYVKALEFAYLWKMLRR